MLVWALLLLQVTRADAPSTVASSDLPDRIAGWLDSVVLLVNGPAWCSGVVIDAEGTVATAYHCIASGLRTQVTTRAGEEFIGRVIAVRPKDDVALLQVPDLAGKVEALELRIDTPRQGERVYGLGHPFAPAAGRSDAMEGMLQWSVTEGIVSAVGPRLIQTDAALNPGNSGGPVVDQHGRIIGITSRKIGGDNVAFLSAVSNLRELVDDPEPPSVFGGQWYLGISIMGGVEWEAAQALVLTGQAILRDRVIAGIGIALPTDARAVAMQRGRAWYPLYEGSLGIRQRLGRGTWSTSVDAGGGIYGTSDLYSEYDVATGTWRITQDPIAFAPGVYGRVAVSAVGLRLVVLPAGRNALVAQDPQDEVYLLGIDLDLPGVVSTF